ncbi:hypothetical protein COCOR_01755 [Corallococcus coralloides DSM 2259]|uniref:Lipoprotein n=1 Tax=Corallococcus coralloides (strain ATCC 25202 / DSM 2259 / NBRC 100086 / M2) TaxID=1144275 RepID=H8N1E7_CORCM|nr:hypothetical protein [Corallococcus coralloides]AFE04275.1 hypothetical protein COCOR_01755 [Corallococcus coralloides DSM 2259]
MTSPRFRPFVLAAVSSSALVLGACAGGTAATRPAESLSVRELNIVDENGQTRIRIAAPMPNPQGLKRAATAHGLQFLSPTGQEIGGLGLFDINGIRALCFDSDEGYESMCMGLIQGQPTVTFRHDWKERITMGVENGVASIVIHDGQGNPRIKLEVDKDGKTRTVGVTPEPAAP